MILSCDSADEECAVLQFLCGVVTWLVILIAVPALVSEAVCLLFPKYLEIYPLSALQICTQALIASIGVQLLSFWR